MANGIFGTDGVRGRSNTYPITAETAMRLAQAAAAHFRRQDGGPLCAVIGKDTRRSGYMLETAMVAGFTSVGMDVRLAGPIPTPAIAMLTRETGATLGVMISASHNPYFDNGIKFFGPDGYKLSDADELAISAGLRQAPRLAEPEHIGGAQRLDDARERYGAAIRQTLPPGLSLRGMKVVVDAANGSAYHTAPDVLAALGAEVVAVGCAPNGLNINDGCGSTSPEACAAAVIAHRADLGIALDGDADRAVLIDERGRVVDGDQLLALIAGRMQAQGVLRTQSLVATIMSNIGLERHLASRGLTLLRSKVGDRYVTEMMRDRGCNLGGEQSGHIILSDHATTGDGLLAAVHAIAAVQDAGRPASDVLTCFQPLPQVQRSLRLDAILRALDGAAVEALLAEARGALGSRGRLVVRPSGTEPVLRVMVEGESLSEITGLADELCVALEIALRTDRAAGALPGSSPEPTILDPKRLQSVSTARAAARDTRPADAQSLMSVGG